VHYLDQSRSTPQSIYEDAYGGGWIVEPGGGGEAVGLTPGDAATETPYPMPLPPPAPAVAPTPPAPSSWLYAAAIGFGLLALLGRSRR